MSKKISNYVWGIFIVFLGLILLFKTLGLITFDIFFSGWWTLFIIIPSLVDIVVNDHKMTSFNFLILGIVFLLSCQKIIESPVIVFVCIMIIELGLKILFGKQIKNIKKNENAESYIGIFGESNASNNSSNFQGCDLVSIFGTVKLDLSEIKLKKDVKIDAVNVFGSIYLTVPDDINVKINGVNIFGSSYPKKTKVDSKYTIYIENVSIFGDIRIK